MADLVERVAALLAASPPLSARDIARQLKSGKHDVNCALYQSGRFDHDDGEPPLWRGKVLPAPYGAGDYGGETVTLATVAAAHPGAQFYCIGGIVEGDVPAGLTLIYESLPPARDADEYHARCALREKLAAWAGTPNGLLLAKPPATVSEVVAFEYFAAQGKPVAILGG